MPTYADVRVDLAKAFLEHKVKSDWPRQVDTLLKRALELDPENAKAKFVYARFYFAEETRDYAKAEPYLTAAPFDSTSLFMLAQALSNRGALDDPHTSNAGRRVDGASRGASPASRLTTATSHAARVDSRPPGTSGRTSLESDDRLAAVRWRARGGAPRSRAP